MKFYTLIIFLGLLLYGVSCAPKNRLVETKLGDSTKGQVIVENEIFKVFLPKSKVVQYLKKSQAKGKITKSEILNILSETDNLQVELSESNLKANSNIQLEIYPVLVELLKSGEATVFNKKKKIIEEKVAYYHIDESLVGEQINFSIGNIRLFTYVISFGE